MCLYIQSLSLRELWIEPVPNLFQNTCRLVVVVTAQLWIEPVPNLFQNSCRLVVVVTAQSCPGCIHFDYDCQQSICFL
jgi:hypothetical protein